MLGREKPQLRSGLQSPLQTVGLGRCLFSRIRPKPQQERGQPRSLRPAPLAASSSSGLKQGQRAGRRGSGSGAGARGAPAGAGAGAGAGPAPRCRYPGPGGAGGARVPAPLPPGQGQGLALPCFRAARSPQGWGKGVLLASPPWGRLLSPAPSMQALSTMTSLEEGAWAPIHHAAVRNHAATMARLLDTAGPEELEAPTRDGLRNTPLLLAAASASYQVAELLVGRGADVAALNAQQHGVAELCALHGHWALLRYFLALGDPRVNVCARLISLLQSDVDREALSAGLALAHLMDEASGAAPCPAPRLLEQGLVPAVLGMLGKDASHTVKEQALHLLNSLLRARGGKEEVAKHGGIQVLVSLLSEGAEGLLGGVVGAICEIACEKSFAEELHSAGAIPAFQRVLSAARRGSSSCLGTGSGEPLAAGSLRSLDLMAEACKSCKDDMGKQHGFLSGLVQLAEECRSPSLMIVWSEVVESVTANHPNNQAAFLAVDGAVPLIHMMKSKARDVQLQAIKALHR